MLTAINTAVLMFYFRLLLVLFIVLLTPHSAITQVDPAATVMHKAPAPLFRDPIYDGAADPVLVYNRGKKEWWMFYTQRRANVTSANVAFCYGTSIGVAVTADHGQTWWYKGAPVLEFEEGVNTFWAPDIFFEKGVYHMFVAYIPGVRNNWGGKARIVHFSSPDLWHWKFIGRLNLFSDNVIDPTFMKLPDGKWHIWYKNDATSLTMTGESKDLVNWKLESKPAIGGKPHEGPKIFRFKDSYWMITDEWAGLRVYRSADARSWERQGMILDKNGVRPDDTPTGAHADVVVTGGKCYVFYFTHPGRKTHFAAELEANGTYSYDSKRSSIQVAELRLSDNTLIAIRDEPFDFWMSDPDNKN